MAALQRVALAGVYILLLFTSSAQQVNHSANYSPSSLSQPVGETAQFNCTIPKGVMNPIWYKEANKQPKKLIEFTEGGVRTEKYSISQVDPQTFLMEMFNLAKNDTGTYYCGLISFASDQTVVESNRANLTVTERANTTKEPDGLEEEEEEDGRRDYDNHRIPLAVIGGVGLFFLLACLCYFLSHTIRKRQVEQKSHDENSPLEEEPRAVSVFTVDYGVLAFHGSGSTRAPRKCVPSDHTEYATIIFPPERPGTPDEDKRTKTQRSCPQREQWQ